jgi:hypothetical protein
MCDQGEGSGEIALFTLESGLGAVRSLLSVPLPSPATCIAGMFNGDWAIGLESGAVAVVSPAGDKVEAVSLRGSGHHVAVSCIAQTSGRIISGSSDGKVLLWSSQLVLLGIFDVRYEGLACEVYTLHGISYIHIYYSPPQCP